MEVGSYRLDSMGNQQQKTVSNCVQLPFTSTFSHTYCLIDNFKAIPMPCKLPCIDECSDLECIVYAFILGFLLNFPYMLT
jgi:hypothetical protein